MDSKGRRVKHDGFRRVGVATALLYCYTRERMDGGRRMIIWALVSVGVLIGVYYARRNKN